MMQSKEEAETLESYEKMKVRHYSEVDEEWYDTFIPELEEPELIEAEYDGI